MWDVILDFTKYEGGPATIDEKIEAQWVEQQEKERRHQACLAIAEAVVEGRVRIGEDGQITEIFDLEGGAE